MSEPTKDSKVTDHAKEVVVDNAMKVADGAKKHWSKIKKGVIIGGAAVAAVVLFKVRKGMVPDDSSEDTTVTE